MSAAGDFTFRLGITSFAFFPICRDKVLLGLIFSGIAIFAGCETGAFRPGVPGSPDGPIVSIVDGVAGDAPDPEPVGSLRAFP